jgi:hypothetical protein
MGNEASEELAKAQKELVDAVRDVGKFARLEFQALGFMDLNRDHKINLTEYQKSQQPAEDVNAKFKAFLDSYKGSVEGGALDLDKLAQAKLDKWKEADATLYDEITKGIETKGQSPLELLKQVATKMENYRQ